MDPNLPPVIEGLRVALPDDAISALEAECQSVAGGMRPPRQDPPDRSHRGGTRQTKPNRPVHGKLAKALGVEVEELFRNPRAKTK
jgi:hypothetical protein